MANEEDKTPFFYVNVVQAHMGAYDITFEFGRKGPDDSATLGFTPVCQVAMSLSHAKTMLPILARLIQQYESNFGSIPAPGYDEKSKE